jgi:hypothetical protein
MSPRSPVVPLRRWERDGTTAHGRYQPVAWHILKPHQQSAYALSALEAVDRWSERRRPQELTSAEAADYDSLQIAPSLFRVVDGARTDHDER